MNRRGFFKGIAATAAVALVPSGASAETTTLRSGIVHRDPVTGQEYGCSLPDKLVFINTHDHGLLETHARWFFENMYALGYEPFISPSQPRGRIKFWWRGVEPFDAPLPRLDIPNARGALVGVDVPGHIGGHR